MKVITDHTANVTLYENPIAKLPQRSERWAMRLVPYQPMIEYIKCCDNPSDYLSRHPPGLREEFARRTSGGRIG